MINLLQATAPAPQAGGGYSLFIMLGLMILVLYFFMWRPESKRRKQMAQFRAGLKKGDKIITAGGIYGVYCNKRTPFPVIGKGSFTYDYPIVARNK